MIETKIRNHETEKDELRKSLHYFGYNLGIQICTDKLLTGVNVCTPMGCTYQGNKIDDSYNNIIISTKNDYQYFAAGVSQAVDCSYTGYIDFNGARGKSTYTEPIRSIELPDILNGKPVGNVIIAKSVIATGCTAISLAKKALEKYFPKNLIIVSVFYSKNGIDELNYELPNADIYVGTNSDNIDENGMLIPGIGNIDIRTE
ncbi:MAG: uracil phosphoribosyltransferase [Ruminococcus flavefaciens]|nr:uracil phosphoribosyltransferase [Ruminococcus flavefaciens]